MEETLKYSKETNDFLSDISIIEEKILQILSINIINSPYFYVELGNYIVSLTTETSKIYSIEKKYLSAFYDRFKIFTGKKEIFDEELEKDILFETIIPKLEGVYVLNDELTKLISTYLDKTEKFERLLLSDLKYGRCNFYNSTSISTRAKAKTIKKYNDTFYNNIS